jgi:hypothetical protein
MEHPMWLVKRGDEICFSYNMPPQIINPEDGNCKECQNVLKPSTSAAAQS